MRFHRKKLVLSVLHPTKEKYEAAGKFKTGEIVISDLVILALSGKWIGWQF